MYSQYPATCDVATQQLLADGAKLSQMAYSDPANVAQFEVLKRVEGTPEFLTCPDCDAQCYLARYRPPPGSGLPQVLAICARGTSSVVDWTCDAEVQQVPFSQANKAWRVHAGFHRQFQGLRRLFDGKVKEHLQGGGTLLCVGHSLGSSVAAIAAVSYALSYPQKVWFAGYGTPRVFNPALAAAFDGCVHGRWRVKNGSDPVNSVLPPIDYVHAGQEVHLGPSDPCPDIPVLFHISDHDIAEYIARLLQQPVNKPTVHRDWLATRVSNPTPSRTCGSPQAAGGGRPA